MNPDTGKVYDEEAAIARAWARGEKLVPIAAAAAKRIKAGRRLLEKKLRADRARRKRRKLDAIRKASRKRNRHAR